MFISLTKLQQLRAVVNYPPPKKNGEQENRGGGDRWTYSMKNPTLLPNDFQICAGFRG